MGVSVLSCVCPSALVLSLGVVVLIGGPLLWYLVGGMRLSEDTQIAILYRHPDVVEDVSGDFPGRDEKGGSWYLIHLRLALGFLCSAISWKRWT